LSTFCRTLSFHKFLITTFLLLLANLSCPYAQTIELDTSWFQYQEQFKADPSLTSDSCSSSLINIPLSYFDAIDDSDYTVIGQKFGHSNYMFRYNTTATTDSATVDHGITTCYNKSGEISKKRKDYNGIMLWDSAFAAGGQLYTTYTLDTLTMLHTESVYLEDGSIKTMEVADGENQVVDIIHYPAKPFQTSTTLIEASLDLNNSHIYVDTISVYGVAYESLFLKATADVGLKRLERVSSSGLSDTKVDIEVKIKHNGKAVYNFGEIKVSHAADTVTIPIALKGYHISYTTLESDTTVVIQQPQSGAPVLIDVIGTETGVAVSGCDEVVNSSLWYNGGKVYFPNLLCSEWTISIGSCHVSGRVRVVGLR